MFFLEEFIREYDFVLEMCRRRIGGAIPGRAMRSLETL